MQLTTVLSLDRFISSLVASLAFTKHGHKVFIATVNRKYLQCTVSISPWCLHHTQTLLFSAQSTLYKVQILSSQHNDKCITVSEYYQFVFHYGSSHQSLLPPAQPLVYCSLLSSQHSLAAARAQIQTALTTALSGSLAGRLCQISPVRRGGGGGIT